MTETASTEAPATDERPTIKHPVWCKAETEESGQALDEWAFTAPAEPARDEIHRGRLYHVESGDVTIAMGLIQSYELGPQPGRLSVSPAAIDFTMTDHGSYHADAGTWLNLAEAKALHELLDRAIDDLERWPHLPVSD